MQKGKLKDAIVLPLKGGGNLVIGLMGKSQKAMKPKASKPKPKASKVTKTRRTRRTPAR